MITRRGFGRSYDAGNGTGVATNQEGYVRGNLLRGGTQRITAAPPRGTTNMTDPQSWVYPVVYNAV